ncbi:conserved hypothetical protein [Parafrankia sp. EAN1pec]|uniref:oxygenase MpaB family protein n=1 Tax=Parafrankia sp. (strain EAN1pec) TaxID=298653 RepID=UPI0000543A6E|nr:conserved hypothetical protein [Frankia sp. EAN1pec]
MTDHTSTIEPTAAPRTLTVPTAAAPVRSEEVDWALGPGSVTWEVMKDPAVFLVGLLREAILLTLHPPFAAAAIDHDSFLDDPVMRFRRVAMYAYSATYGTKADAERVSAMVRRRHFQIVGVEPLSGEPYRADSEYELALTQAMLAASFLAVYEEVHGRLSTARRDQFLMEQKVPAALLGVPPEHMPSTWGDLQRFLARARDGFATGYQAREIIDPFSRGSYPPGSVLGDLPTLKRQAAMWLIRAIADMAILTMNDEERALLAIDRRPKLRSQAAIRLSLRALSRYLRSEKGTLAFEGFVKANTAKIMRRAFEVDRKPGRRAREKAFRVPDAAGFVVQLPDLVHNWPGSRSIAEQPKPVEGPSAHETRAGAGRARRAG